jgi:acyl-CoA thioesterase FadM
MTEDQVLNKYETEFSQYCFDVLDVTHNDAYLRLMENGRFWEWLEEYHYEDWQALEIEDLKWEIKKLKAKIKELEERK